MNEIDILSCPHGEEMETHPVGCRPRRDSWPKVDMAIWTPANGNSSAALTDGSLGPFVSLSKNQCDWSRLPRLPVMGSDRGAPIEIEPFSDGHYRSSQAMIAEVISRLPPGGAAQVLGAGYCRDIPLACLAGHFAETVLIEIDPARLKWGLASQPDVPASARERLRAVIRDLGATTQLVAQRAEVAIDASASVGAAVEAVGAILDGTFPPAVSTPDGVFDLSICSGVLTQVDAPIWRAVTDRLKSRFGASFDRAAAEQLRGHQRALGHRFRLQLVSQLASQTRGGGAMYLADTMRVAHLSVSAGGRWSTRGAYRMGRCEALADYLDRRWIILGRRTWDWVDLDDADDDGHVRGGRLWFIEALAVVKRPLMAGVISEGWGVPPQP